MGRERGQKKSFESSLEDIKQKMKEKRAQRESRVLRAQNGNAGRRILVNKTSDANILKGMQANNKELALGLQAEKEKVRQLSDAVLKLKGERQALYGHLLICKRLLSEMEAKTVKASAAKSRPMEIPAKPAHPSRRLQSTPRLNDAPQYSPSPDESPRHPVDKHMVPPTVCVRRGSRAERSSSRRRSSRIHLQTSLSEGSHPSSSAPGDDLEAMDALTASPICPPGLPPGSDAGPRNQTQSSVRAAGASKEPRRDNPSEASRTDGPPPQQQQQQQPRRKGGRPRKSDPAAPAAARKPERGRKPERAPLKKPWDNPKPRARSKSRDRSATRPARAGAAAPPQVNTSLNTSQGHNDTFDFDCEDGVHLTPFKGKADASGQPGQATAVQEGPRERTSQPKGAAAAPPPRSSTETTESEASSDYDESEDSLYVPRGLRHVPRGTARGSPEGKKVIPTRSRPLPKASGQKEKVSAAQKTPEASRGAEEEEDEEEEEEIPVTPGEEADMRQIHDVLSSLEDSLSHSETPPPLLPTSQTPQRAKANTCKKRGLGVRMAGRGLSLCDVTNLSPAAYRNFSRDKSRPSDARCSTPVGAPRKRRCTMTVDYKEPSLGKKLRRGDKFTDLQFLSSPIFKQSASRRSVQSSRKSTANRKSTNSQQPFQKYNESFVGCC